MLIYILSDFVPVNNYKIHVFCKTYFLQVFYYGHLKLLILNAELN